VESYSGAGRFEPVLRHRLSRNVFRGFLPSLRATARYLRLSVEAMQRRMISLMMNSKGFESKRS
jgi:hypothetical protein